MLFFIDITNIFVNMTDFSCHFNQKDALRIPNECLCVTLLLLFNEDILDTTNQLLICLFTQKIVAEVMFIIILSAQ